MKQTVLIKNVEFGAGQPKICLPVVARTDAEIRQQLMTIAHGQPPGHLDVDGQAGRDQPPVR